MLKKEPSGMKTTIPFMKISIKTEIRGGYAISKFFANFALHAKNFNKKIVEITLQKKITNIK